MFILPINKTPQIRQQQTFTESCTLSISFKNYFVIIFLSSLIFIKLTHIFNVCLLYMYIYTPKPRAYWKAYGQWMRQRSRYSSFRSFKVFNRDGSTSSGWCLVFHSLEVTNTSSRLIPLKEDRGCKAHMIPLYIHSKCGYISYMFSTQLTYFFRPHNFLEGVTDLWLIRINGSTVNVSIARLQSPNNCLFYLQMTTYSYKKLIEVLHSNQTQ